MTTIAQTAAADKLLTATIATDPFAAAVRQVSELAHARLPEALHGNLERATALVLHGQVWREDDGTWQVQASDGQTWYRPNGHCACHNAATAEGGWCKHRLATALYRRAAERVQEQTGAVDVAQAFAAAPSPAPVALPEAPASVNTYITIAGRQVQLTLRDTDEARLLSRLQVILAQYPCAAPPATVTPAPARSVLDPYTGPTRPGTAPVRWPDDMAGACYPVPPAAPVAGQSTPEEEPQLMTCSQHGIVMKASKHAEGTFYCPKKETDGSYCGERYPKKAGRR